MKATGCNQGDACDKFHPRIPGKCFRCGSTSHGLQACTGPVMPKGAASEEGASGEQPTSAKAEMDKVETKEDYWQQKPGRLTWVHVRPRKTLISPDSDWTSTRLRSYKPTGCKGPSFGEYVGAWRSRDKAQIKSLEPRGIICRLLQVNLSEGHACLVLMPDGKVSKRLQPKKVEHMMKDATTPMDQEDEDSHPGWLESDLELVQPLWSKLEDPTKKTLWVRNQTKRRQGLSFVAALPQTPVVIQVQQSWIVL
eukprot:2645198-Amphidinium_carterae.4